MTALTKWQPFSELTSLQGRINRLFNDFFPEFDLLEPASLTASAFMPVTDLFEESDRVMLEMEIPGLRPEDFNLTLGDNRLTISGQRKVEEEKKEGQYRRAERSYGSFLRSFTLPSSVDPASIKASYENGILYVTIMKKADARPRHIKVTGESKQLSALDREVSGVTRPQSRRARWRGWMRDVQSDDRMFGTGMQSHGKVALRLGKRISKNFSDPSHSIAVRCLCITSMSRHSPGDSQNSSVTPPPANSFDAASSLGNPSMPSHLLKPSLNKLIQYRPGIPESSVRP